MPGVCTPRISPGLPRPPQPTTPAFLLPAEVHATCPDKTGCPTDPNWALHALSLYDYNLHRRLDWG